MKLQKISRSFFARNPLEVANELPGNYLVRKKPVEELYTLAQIIEVRAFEGIERKMNPYGMMRPYGLFYIAPFRGRKLLNVTTTTSPKKPSCVWIYRVNIDESEYGPSQLMKELELDESFDGISVESDELFFLRRMGSSFGELAPIVSKVEEVNWESSPRNYVGGFRLAEPLRALSPLEVI